MHVIDGIDGFKSGLAQLMRRLERLETRRVNAASHKKAVRDLVLGYFARVRPSIVSAIHNQKDVASLDDTMQELLRCTQRRVRVSRYLALMRKCRSELNSLDLALVTSQRGQIPIPGLAARGPRDRVILETLRKLNASAAASYEQGLLDLEDATRISWRGTAVEFREALRETIDTLAPDSEIKSHGRVNLGDEATNPTMKQKIRFILRNRGQSKNQAKPTQRAVEIVEQTLGPFVRSVYDRASVAVHTRIAKQEALRVKEYVTTALADLLEVQEQ